MAREISWLSLMDKADPGWRKESLTPICYRFSKGRTFRQKINPYS